MSGEEVSAGVRAFLSETIGSYEHLELLRLMCAHRDTAWSRKTVAERLTLDKDNAAEALRHLVRHRLLDMRESEAETSYVYAPATRALEELVEALMHAYDNNRLGIIELMSAMAIERARNEAVQFFADAFVLGRKRNRDG